MEELAEVVYKVIVVGDAGVGKTSLARRYTTGQFDESYLFTLGVDFFTKQIKLKDDTNIKLVIYDTGGQERFDFIRGLYFEGAAGAIIAYDVTDQQSFDRIDHWMQQVYQRCEGIPLLLVGCKSDLKEQRVVPEKGGKDVAKELKMDFLESSAKDDYNVDDVFESLAKKIYSSYEKAGKPWDRI
ncbi:MAG: Rab family GTPase [Candidatus Thorarchaeota archaeon]